MVKSLKLEFLANSKEKIEKALRRGFALALGDMKSWVEGSLIPALVFGGLGIRGLAKTPFYKWISSPEGLSQLGIPPSEPPKLLQSYEQNAFKVSHNNSTLLLHFGDVAQLKLDTAHPATGTGQLQVESWLDWIIDPVEVVDNYGYVERQDLPKNFHKFIRLSSPLGGLMLPADKFGSMGQWEFPARYQNYDIAWLKQNENRIINAISKQLIKFLNARLK